MNDKYRQNFQYKSFWNLGEWYIIGYSEAKAYTITPNAFIYGIIWASHSNAFEIIL